MFRRYLPLLLFLTAHFTTQAVSVSLDSCRAMAVAHNRQLQIARERLKAAGYQASEARSAFLPAIDIASTYIYNQKNISIFGSDQFLPVKTFNPETGGYEYNIVKDAETGQPLKGPDGQYVPESVAYMPKESMTYDVHNLFWGAITLTQPIYMGGKILAMNRIAEMGERLEEAILGDKKQDIIYQVDVAYWQVISLEAKRRAAVNYVEMLDTLRSNVQAMYNEGVSTRSDLLSVDVKLNQAQLDMLRVEDGLALSRMSLAQLCGLPINDPMVLVDEEELLRGGDVYDASKAGQYDLSEVLLRRNDVKALKLGVKISEQRSLVAKSSMLPEVVLMGAYSLSNPNLYNGFRRQFEGNFSIGVAVKIPIWHWGGNYNKYRASKAEVTIAKLNLLDAQEKISLQISQARFKMQEAQKTFDIAKSNLSSAEENMRVSIAMFKEGMTAITNVLEAQTVWLKAQSENIDAQIGVRLCSVYLSKVSGSLGD